MLSDELKKEIRGLWDKFWSRGITNPITAIEQISYLLFIRRLEETDNEKIINSRKNKERYKSIFIGIFKLSERESINKRELKWSAFKKLKGEKLVEFVSTKVFPFIKQLNDVEQPYARHMKNAVFIITNPNLLEEAIEDIEIIFQHVSFDKYKRGRQFQDTQGDVYEYLLSQLSLAGKNGQFRTPRHIIQLICELVNPTKQDTICDPACGSGGFLLGAYQHILTANTTAQFLIEDEDGFKRGLVGNKLANTDWNKLTTKTFYGYDIDQNMVRIALMNLMLHNISQPQIENLDALSQAFDAYLDKSEIKEFSIILANPPFAGKISSKDRSSKLKEAGNETALLFLQRSMQILKIEGRAGIIVPEGVLYGSNKSLTKIRENLLRSFSVEAVISLPVGVFKPYAGVKTAVLLFNRPKVATDEFVTQQVWFYEIKSDGYSLDDQRKPLKTKTLPKVVEDFRKSRTTTSYNRKLHHFHVPVEVIKSFDYDLSIGRYKEVDHIEAKYDPPKETLKILLKLERDILQEFEELNNLIK
jgi:type I restriction enzyme M protein